MAWQAIPPSGYFVELTDTCTRTSGHVFCGRHSVPGAWCPNCDKPFLRFLRLDLSDPLIQLFRAGEYVSLVYCWTCPVAQEDLYYQCRIGGGISILSCGRGSPSSEFPYSDYPVSFPERNVRLVPIPHSTQELFCKANRGKLSGTYSDVGGMPVFENAPGVSCQDAVLRAAGMEPTHQIGGEPLLLDTYWPMRCPKCRRRMPFLASIGNESGTEGGFSGNPCVQVLYHYCRTCRCVGAYHQTD
jgi:hypothetical protein